MLLRAQYVDGRYSRTICHDDSATRASGSGDAITGASGVTRSESMRGNLIAMQAKLVGATSAARLLRRKRMFAVR
jgi:hypothetical protein